ncbi:hypothetical protein JOE11_000891 [Robbsia andropogonis]
MHDPCKWRGALRRNDTKGPTRELPAMQKGKSATISPGTLYEGTNGPGLASLHAQGATERHMQTALHHATKHATSAEMPSWQDVATQ